MNLRFTLYSSLLLLGASCSVFNDNLRPVEREKFYRAGQMGRARLDAVIDRHDIKTVVNLRGANPDELWYQRELVACEANETAHVDLKLTMRRIPEPESLANLVDIIENAEKPILVHCQAGVHRAGTASAVYRLITGDSVDEARQEFGLFFMNAPIGNLLDLYDGSKPFAQWVREDYPRIYAERVGS
ncbi:MAG TPA: tyrosine-protein phosphatase [Candidatus Hydrogenedentes bacterium]|nr:tyrosine-protein phosphatase [Candidatus Hydrogenedentota bacterium]